MRKVYGLEQLSNVINGTINRKLPHVLYLPFFTFCFFPWSEVLPTGTNLQPYSLLYGCFILFISQKNKIYKNTIYPLILVIIGIVFLFIDGFSFSALRSLMNYISFTVIYMVSIQYFINYNSEKIKFMLYVTISIWFLVGLIQSFFIPSFMYFFIPAASLFKSVDSEMLKFTGRGVLGLAAEPTYHAMHMYALLLLFFFTHSEIIKKKVYLFMILISITLISKSTSVYIILMGLILIYLILNFSVRSAFLLISPLFLIFIGLKLDQLNNLRFFHLLDSFISDPIYLIQTAKSVNDRLGTLFLSHVSFIYKAGLPGGFGTWEIFSKELMQKFEFITHITAGDSRIHSNSGSVIYEYGVLSILYFLTFYNSKAKSSFLDINKKLSYYGLFLLIPFAIPVAYPVIPIILGFHYAYNLQSKYKCNFS